MSDFRELEYFISWVLVGSIKFEHVKGSKCFEVYFTSVYYLGILTLIRPNRSPHVGNQNKVSIQSKHNTQLLPYMVLYTTP